MKAVEVVIRGRVQGVGFRWNTRNTAVGLGLKGYVRNAADGSVEAVFVGNDAQVEQMIAWCRQGPSAAKVSGVDVQDIAPKSYDSFTIE